MHLSDIEKARIFSNEMLTIKGKGNHMGSAVGKSLYLDFEPHIPQSYLQKTDEELRYFAAHRTLTERLRRRYGELRSENDAAWIFLLQITLLYDDLFFEMPRVYLEEGKSAAQSVILCREYFHTVMCKKDESGYLRSISADVNDISIALINTICENEERLLSADRIVVCHTPPPSFIAANKDNLLGIVTSDNEPQSHAAELAASFNIPYIASDNELSHIIDEENALINSDKGYLYLNPDLSTLTKFSDLDRQKRNEKEKEDELSTMPLLTRDGKQIFVYAELKRPHELTPFSERYCDGIGSLSNEDYYLESAYPPDEEELFEEYRRAAEIMPTKPIIIKAFKGAGSVHLNSIVNENGETPGGELYVLCDGAFRIQLRAVMRAAVYGSLHFLIQCTEKYSDLSQCAQMMEELSAELYEEDREFTPVPFGIIIDTIPSALMCERLIDECDFFVVDREKLSKALFTETPDEILFDKDDIYLDALEHLMTSVAKAAAKKKKRALLSLGKCSFAESISLDVINEFSSVSASLDKIYALKKKIIEM